MTEGINGTPQDVPVTLSVVIAVYNAAAYLERCLTALSRSTYDQYECMVVDDGSEDDSGQVARRHGARVITLAGRHGPAHARNRGAERARGEILCFIDADVCVHPETIGAVAATFARHPDAAAMIGSYDDQPGDPSFLSQYKNLFHHYVHQCSSEEASTFWSGCGAVRRDLFLAMGGFNEGYAKPCIEDIEFGFRLRTAGHPIRLEKGIQVTHLKRWGLLNMIQTDLFFRGVPWVALMLRDRRITPDLNLRWWWRAGTALTYLLAGALVMLAGTGHARAALPVMAAVGVGLISAILYDRLPPRLWLPACSFGLAALAPALWKNGGLEPLALLPIGLLLAILTIHRSFYRFFARTRGPNFAAAVLPLHLLYFLYSGLAVPLGMLAYARDQRQARRWMTGPALVPARPLEPKGFDAPLKPEPGPPMTAAGAGSPVMRSTGSERR